MSCCGVALEADDVLVGADDEAETDECAVVSCIGLDVGGDCRGIGSPSCHLTFLRACASNLARPFSVVAKAASMRARQVSE